jgi:acyl dehydratase
LSTDDRRDLDSIQTILDLVGQPPIVSEPVLIDQEMIDQFGKTTFDMQWIHVDVDRAKAESPYGGTIAHGFLTLSLISAWYNKCFTFSNRKLALNYGFDKIRFLSIVPAGSLVTGSFQLAKADRVSESDVRITWLIEVRVVGAEKPAIIANWITQLRY